MADEERQRRPGDLMKRIQAGGGSEAEHVLHALLSGVVQKNDEAALQNLTPSIRHGDVMRRLDSLEQTVRSIVKENRPKPIDFAPVIRAIEGSKPDLSPVLSAISDSGKSVTQRVSSIKFPEAPAAAMVSSDVDLGPLYQQMALLRQAIQEVPQPEPFVLPKRSWRMDVKRNRAGNIREVNVKEL